MKVNLTKKDLADLQISLIYATEKYKEVHNKNFEVGKRVLRKIENELLKNNNKEVK